MLEEPDGGAILSPGIGGSNDACLWTIFLKNGCYPRGVRANIYKALDRFQSLDEIWLGNATWKEQLREALYVTGNYEDQPVAGWIDWVSHIIQLIGQMFYALCTPPDC